MHKCDVGLEARMALKLPLMVVIELTNNHILAET